MDIPFSVLWGGLARKPIDNPQRLQSKLLRNLSHYRFSLFLIFCLPGLFFSGANRIRDPEFPQEGIQRDCKSGILTRRLGLF